MTPSADIVTDNSTEIHSSSSDDDKGATRTPKATLSKNRQEVFNTNPSVRFFNKTRGIVWLALKRILFHPGLSLLALLGVILAIGLITSAGFFSQAVDKVILDREMAEYTRITGRPPFSARVYTFSSRSIPLTIERAEVLGENVADTLSSEIGLPINDIGLFADSGVLQLFSDKAEEAEGDGESTASQVVAGKSSTRRSGGEVNLFYIRDVAEHLNIVDGSAFDTTPSDAILNVWMHQGLAGETGLNIGDTFTVGPRSRKFEIPVRVAGLWQAEDSDDPFWLDDPDAVMIDQLLVRRQDYIAYVEPFLDVKVRAVTWPVTLDQTKVVPGSVRTYVEGFERGEAVILKYLPDARVTAPSTSLGKFVLRQTALTTLLLGFNVPALGFLLYFLILTSGVIAYWQRRETAVLLRRGMNRLEIFTLTLVETFLLFIVGCPLGLGFGILLARLMGNTVSFLEFSPRTPLPVSLNGINISLILLTLGILFFARIISSFSVDRRNLVSQEREHARPQRPPFWYRNYLELLLILPTYYAYQQLLSRGSLALLIDDRPEDMFRDPLLIVVPALFVLTMALMSMRAFAVIMRLLDKVALIVPWLTVHLSLRQLGRQGHTYINPMLLVIVSLALGVYTLSMAASLDQWLVDRMYHRAGADLSIIPYSEGRTFAGAAAPDPTGGVGSGGASAYGAGWIPPVGDYEALPGVANAAKVGDYKAIIKLAAGGGSRIDARFLAIDRIEFPYVAWFRFDFARESLGSLMNRLAPIPAGILVSQGFLDRHNLHIGDHIEIQVFADYDAVFSEPFTVVGVYDYFPTVYDDQVTVVGNIDFVFSFFGTTMPHDIWMHAEENVTGEEMLDVLPTTGVDSIGERDAKAFIAEEQAKMERVGVFGTLSVSFLAAALMAAMGLLTYSYASLQERRLYFAILRAAGLARLQIIGQVAFEYIVLTTFGAIAGVIVGSLTAELFIPLFRVTTEGGAPLPPLLPIIAQGEILPLVIAFSATMIVLEVLLIAAALQRRLFDALRLGY